VLDEPTLGLDLLYRRQFYDSLLNDYFDRSRTIVVTTHQVEEVQHILTDVVFLDRGRVVLEASMEDIEVPLPGGGRWARPARRRTGAAARP
jgi:ABC-2 type transport system ATP-binding protein